MPALTSIPRIPKHNIHRIFLPDRFIIDCVLEVCVNSQDASPCTMISISKHWYLQLRVSGLLQHNRVQLQHRPRPPMKSPHSSHSFIAMKIQMNVRLLHFKSRMQIFRIVFQKTFFPFPLKSLLEKNLTFISQTSHLKSYIWRFFLLSAFFDGERRKSKNGHSLLG